MTRARVLARLRRGWTPWRAAVPLVLVAAGLLFVASAHTAAGTNLRASAARSDLPTLVRERQQQVAGQLADVAALRRAVDDAEKSASGPLLEAARRRLAALSAQAGLTAVRGPGVSVTLDDATVPPGGIPDGFVPDDYVVHQQDVEAVVNALWTGGAEAVEVMDQRLVSTSAVRCVGNTLILQGRVYSPPYRITAIGPVTAMFRALDTAPGVALYRQYVSAVGLGYQVSDHAGVTLPAYDGPLDLSAARVGG